MLPNNRSYEKLVIATDLDGTFLEGSASTREIFYQFIADHSAHLVLIFATGRSLESVQKLYAKEPKLPKADYLIGDVGASAYIYQKNQYVSFKAIEESIASGYNDMHNVITKLLSGIPGLELQPEVSKYKISYFVDLDKLNTQRLSIINDAGYHYIISGNRYLDILPKGVDKGSTLLKILQHEKLNHNKAIVCGDSLNDLSLFQIGIRGVSVGNSESSLVSQLKEIQHVFLSNQAGVQGIIEALLKFNYIYQNNFGEFALHA